MNYMTGKNEQWTPLIQVKLKKGSFTSYHSMTEEHEKLLNEPDELEYRVEIDPNNEEDNQKITVVAIILLRRQFLR